MDTEWVQECERNGYRMGIERIQNGYRTDTKRKWNGYRTVTNHKMEKSVLQNTDYKRTRSSEHMLVSYAIRVLTTDLETM